MTDKRRHKSTAGSAPAAPRAATSPTDHAYWVAYRKSPLANVTLHGPVTLFEAYDAVDKLRRELGATSQVSTAYRADSREDAARNAAFQLTVV